MKSNGVYLSCQKVLGTPTEAGAIAKIYAEFPSISIDYGLLVKSDQLAVVPSDMRWEDVGSWSALDQVVPSNENGNILVRSAINTGNKNSTIYAGSHVVAVLGLDNIVVADTDDATLVCRKEHAQDVKKVVEILKLRGGNTHRVHRAVVLAPGEVYCA